ncbi:glycosyltransferase [Kaarinaea lacus]
MTTQYKIAFLVSTLAGGGAQRFVTNLATEYANQGHEVHIFLQKKEVIYSLPDSIKIHSLTSTTKKPRLKRLFKLVLGRRFRRQIQELSATKPFDLVISTMFGANLIARLSGIPGIVYRISNNLDHRLRKGTNRYFIKRKWMQFLLQAQQIVVLNQEMKQHIIDTLNVSPDNISIITQGFDFRYIKEMAAKPESNLPDQPYILHVGRFQAQKRHDVLLQAYKLAQVPHKLVLLGQGRDKSTRKLNVLIENAGLADNVIQPGFQDNPYPWIKNASLVVISSDYEGLSNVLIEALILGTPVVSTAHISGPRDVMTGEFSQFLSETGDAEGLAKNIVKALDHYPELSEAIVQPFCVETIAQLYLDNFARR